MFDLITLIVSVVYRLQCHRVRYASLRYDGTKAMDKTATRHYTLLGTYEYASFQSTVAYTAAYIVVMLLITLLSFILFLYVHF